MIPDANYTVVGVSFTPGYPDNLHALSAMQEEALASGEPIPVVLIRNPDNEYDANAIEVHCPSLGEYGMIGHLPKDIARRVAPDMDGGMRLAGSVHEVRIHPDHPERPGITVDIWRQKEES